MKKKLAIFLLFFNFLVAHAANYYWVNGSGNWSQLTHWATTNGGAIMHASLPDSSDVVFIDATDTVYVTGDTAWCYHLVNDGLIEQSGGKILVYGDLTNNSDFKQTGGKLVISGLSFNSILGTQDLSLDSLVLDKNGYCDISRDVIIKGNLEFRQGYFFTYTASLIKFEPGATSDGGFDFSYVLGPVEKRGTEAFAFPIGKGGKWARLTISDATVLTDTSIMRAEYFNPHYIDTANYNAPIVRVSYQEYWTLDRVSGVGNFKVRLHFENANFSGIQNIDSATVAKYSGSAWDNIANSNRLLSGGRGWIESNVVTAFSPFTFGTFIYGNTLPVEWLSFDVVLKGNNSVLNWATASEVNNDYFEVERSIDNMRFETLEKIEAKFNPNILLHTYTYKDYNVNLLEDNTLYYRVKQVDFNGESSYTPTQYVNLNQKLDMSFYPNPSDGEFNIKISDLGGVAVLRDVNGRVVMKKKLLQRSNNFLLEGLETGVYRLTYSLKNIQTTNKLIIH